MLVSMARMGMVVWACELGEGSLKMGKQVFRLPILWGMGFAVLLIRWGSLKCCLSRLD